MQIVHLLSKNKKKLRCKLSLVKIYLGYTVYSLSLKYSQISLIQLNKLRSYYVGVLDYLYLRTIPN